MISHLSINRRYSVKPRGFFNYNPKKRQGHVLKQEVGEGRL